MKIKTDNFRNKAKILNPSFPSVLCSKHFEKYNKKKWLAYLRGCFVLFRTGRKRYLL